MLQWRPTNNVTIEPLRLEKPPKIMGSNHEPSTARSPPAHGILKPQEMSEQSWTEADTQGSPTAPPPVQMWKAPVVSCRISSCQGMAGKAHPMENLGLPWGSTEEKLWGRRGEEAVGPPHLERLKTKGSPEHTGSHLPKFRPKETHPTWNRNKHKKIQGDLRLIFYVNSF